jgi:hypothetical protein
LNEQPALEEDGSPRGSSATGLGEFVRL